MRGIVIGKFLPLHKGHSFLIDTALSQCTDLTVLVCDNPKYEIAAPIRRDWIKKIHPQARVEIIKDIGCDDDSIAWAAHTIQFLGYAPDIVFSSEHYGFPYAEAMGASHCAVDIARKNVPISATKIRQNPTKYWAFLDPTVKAHLAKRIVVLGAESTGTTTLARVLAKQLSTEWVPEVGRYYTESIEHTKNKWSTEDFLAIGTLQQAYERAIASRSNGLIVCDTNVVATELWERRYIGSTSKAVHELATTDRADLYVITGDEIPFVQDGIRDGQHIRHDMHSWFVHHIAAQNTPYIIVHGSPTERAMQVLAHWEKVEKLL